MLLTILRVGFWRKIAQANQVLIQHSVDDIVVDGLWD